MEATRSFFDFRRLFPVLVPLVCSFRSALITAHSQKMRLVFLNRCLEEQVLPKSMLPRRLLQFGDLPFEDFHRLILLKNIEIKKVEVRESFKKSRKKKQDLLNALPLDWIRCVFDDCYRKLRCRKRALENRLLNKLNVLINNSKWTTDANPDFIINMSEYNLDPSSLPALGYGLSFSLTPSMSSFIDIAEGFCNLEKFGNVSGDTLNVVKGFIYGVTSGNTYSNVPKRFLEVYKSLKNNNNLHITKADKSNALVILDKEDYNGKIYDLLNDRDTYSTLTSDPYERKLRDFNKKIKVLLKNNPDLIKQLSTISSSLPYLYGLVKTHKPGNPIRPIISSVGSVAYKLSKWLVKLLSPVVGTISNSNIKHNMDFIEKLCNVDVNFSFKLVSFDVKSLFTRVPVDDLLEYLAEILDNYDLPFSTNVVLELIKLCVCDSVFTFNGKFYTQKFGMAMGNPLSPVLSNLYMEFFETKFLPSILPPGTVWLRYVDDIFCIWPLIVNIDAFILQLNSCVPSIQFTYEEEVNGCLPFLDVNIYRTFNGFKFSVFRKPTNACSYIHFYSNHSNQIKMSTFMSMFLRAFRVCSPEYLQNEIDYIFGISEKLKYPRCFMDSALKKARKTFYSDARRTFDNQNLLVLPFSSALSSVPRFCRTFGINVVFRYTSTVKNILIKNSPKNSLGCVYEIPCKDCNHSYFGQSGKGLLTRLKQHKYSVRTGQMSNGIFLHLNNFNHRINWEGAKVLLYCNNITKRNIIESALIRNSSNLMNISQGMYKLDRFIINHIFSLFPR